MSCKFQCVTILAVSTSASYNWGRKTCWCCTSVYGLITKGYFVCVILSHWFDFSEIFHNILRQLYTAMSDWMFASVEEVIRRHPGGSI